MLGDEPIH